MSMDLRRECHHCGAEVGEICKETCSVNGEEVKALIKALADLDLSLDEICIKPRKYRCRG